MANPYFNAAYYLAHNPDLVLAGITADTAEQHYDDYGAAENRSPNGWFDPEAYLAANPDLIAAGVTPATALDHFAQYGINEGRIFSNDARLDPSNFDASGYAAANTDVADALGITDPSDLTDAQVGELLGHFLIYGAAEDREGAGDLFTEAVDEATESANLVELSGANPADATGTVGDDLFVWHDAGADSAALPPFPDHSIANSISGLAGDDTLSIHMAAGGMDNVAANISSIEHVEIINTDATATNVDAAITGSGVQSLSIDTADSTVVTYTGSAVSDFSLENGGADLEFSGVSGSNDSLNVTLSNTAEGLAVHGVETVNVDAASDVFISVSDVQGSSVAVNLSGGIADTAATAAVVIGDVDDDSITSATVDASSYASNLDLSVDVANVENSADIAVTTGSGNDAITVTGAVAGQTVTVDAGAGDDSINATAATDIMTGGDGADVFSFAAVTDAVAQFGSDGNITAVDTITDFSNTDDGAVADQVDFASVALGDLADAAIGTVDGAGVVTFATNFLSGKNLTEIVTALDADTDMSGAGDSVLFNFDGNAYLFVQGGTAGNIADDGLIQLTGADAHALEIDAGVGVAFAA